MILIVPEQGSYEAEHALVNAGGIRGMMRAQVLSFRRLAYRVMQETGGAAKVAISEEGKRIFAVQNFAEAQRRAQLFGASGERHGFVGKLSELYTEMKRYCVTLPAWRISWDRCCQALGILRCFGASWRTSLRSFEILSLRFQGSTWMRKIRWLHWQKA